VTHRDVITAAVAAAHPGWPSSKIDAEGASRFLQSLLPHAILPVVFVLRGRRLLEGRRRTRLIVTFLLGVQLLAHATLPLQLDRLPGYAGWLVAVQSVSLVFELGALWLLWKPQESRTFFARKRTPVPTPA
jgi:hypothetical protein